jgi:hypothetical protein
MRVSMTFALESARFAQKTLPSPSELRATHVRAVGVATLPSAVSPAVSLSATPATVPEQLRACREAALLPREHKTTDAPAERTHSRQDMLTTVRDACQRGSDAKRTSDVPQDNVRELVTYVEPQNLLGRSFSETVLLAAYKTIDVCPLTLSQDVRQAQASGLHRVPRTGCYTVSARFCAVVAAAASGRLSLEVVRIYRDAMSRGRADPVGTSVSYQVLGEAECDVLADGPTTTLQVLCHARLHALECVALQLHSTSHVTVASWISGASHFQIAPCP